MGMLTILVPDLRFVQVCAAVATTAQIAWDGRMTDLRILPSFDFRVLLTPHHVAVAACLSLHHGSSRKTVAGLSSINRKIDRGVSSNTESHGNLETGGPGTPKFSSYAVAATVKSARGNCSQATHGMIFP
jgi:hypothetical protein